MENRLPAKALAVIKIREECYPDRMISWKTDSLKSSDS